MKTFRQKGLGFEIEVAKLLSKWALDDPTLPRPVNKGSNKLFWRTMGSGSIATNDYKRGSIEKNHVSFCGDITALDPCVYRYSSAMYMECKRVKNINLTSLVDNGSPGSLTLLGQKKDDGVLDRCLEQYTNHGKIPVLFLKRDWSKDIIMMVLIHNIPCPDLIPVNHMVCVLKSMPWLVLPLQGVMTVFKFTKFFDELVLLQQKTN